MDYSLESGVKRYSVNEAINHYDLKLRLLDGTDSTMIVELTYAIDNKKEIVVTGGSPHWIFTRTDLRYLEDPKKVFGETEKIHALVRKELK